MDIESLFSENLNMMHHCFPMEYCDKHSLGAYICTLQTITTGKKITKEKINECRYVVRSRVGISTAFRDYLLLPLTLLMAFSDDPSEYLEGIIRTFEEIKPTYFTGTGQRFMMATVLYENTPKDQLHDMCIRTYEIYDEMKKEHPLLTGQEDMTFAALIALDGEEINSVAAEIEECYDILKKRFLFNASPIQNVSHILSLTDIDNTEKSEKFINLFEALKTSKGKFGKGPIYIVLAVLSVLDISVEEAAKEVKDMEKKLSKLKGFGPLGTVGISIRRMIAIALVAFDNFPDVEEIHDVKISLLRTIIRSVMIGSLTFAKSSLAMSSHR